MMTKKTEQALLERKPISDIIIAMEAEETARNGRMIEVYDIKKNSNDKHKTTNIVKDKWKFINGSFGQKGAMERTFRGNI